ncbi:MAG: hypothetical protein ACYDBJ_03195 [Aggregatilineales bacterium]
MLIATQTVLTSDHLRCLSPVAVKLWNAVLSEPDQRQARYIELVGRCERSVRNATRELLGLGLVERTTSANSKVQQADRPVRVDRYSADRPAPIGGRQAGVPDELSDAQRDVYETLRAFGVDDQLAHYWAQHGNKTLIDAALTYTRKRAVQRPAAYLVWCLNHPDVWYIPVVGAYPPDSNPVSEQVSPSPGATETRLAVSSTLPDIPLLSSTPLSANDGSISDSGWPTVAISSTAEWSLTTAEADGGVLVINDDTRDMVLMAYAIEVATGTDVRLSVDARQTVQLLERAGYVAEDIALFADEVFPHRDWRGQKGEKPTMRALLDGIAAVRHERLASNAITEHSLLYRVKALREYLPAVVHIRALADLWSAEVRRAVEAGEELAYTCPECGLPISMCRCGQAATYSGDGTQEWAMLIDELEVQMDRPTFDTWVGSLRLIGFESSPAVDKYVVECKNSYQHEWLAQNLLGYMTERLSTIWVNKPSRIELQIAPPPRWM